MGSHKVSLELRSEVLQHFHEKKYLLLFFEKYGKQCTQINKVC